MKMLICFNDHVVFSSGLEMRFWCFRAVRACLVYISEMLHSWGWGMGNPLLTLASMLQLAIK